VLEGPDNKKGKKDKKYTTRHCFNEYQTDNDVTTKTLATMLSRTIPKNETNGPKSQCVYALYYNEYYHWTDIRKTGGPKDSEESKNRSTTPQPLQTGAGLTWEKWPEDPLPWSTGMTIAITSVGSFTQTATI